MPTEKPSDRRESSPGHNGGLKAKLAARFRKKPDDHEKKVNFVRVCVCIMRTEKLDGCNCSYVHARGLNQVACNI